MAEASDLFNLDRLTLPASGPSRTAFMKACPPWLRGLIDSRYKVKGVEWAASSDEIDEELALHASHGNPTTLGETGVDAEAMYSRHIDDARDHVITLDIDHEAVLLPSSTSGHHHLIVQCWADWEDYEMFLRAAARIGLIEEGYAELSIKRRATCLRLPWIRKGSEREDAQQSMEEWLNEPEAPASTDAF